MKKISIALSILLILSTANVAAYANQSVLDKKFSNCDALKKVYPGGVAKSSKVVNKGGKTKRKPAVNAKVYLENASKDRDKDGIACEN